MIQLVELLSSVFSACQEQEMSLLDLLEFIEEVYEAFAAIAIIFIQAHVKLLPVLVSCWLVEAIAQ